MDVLYTQRKDRDRIIDIIKGLGIIMMVYRHAFGWLSEYLLMFHMAIFFIASGYLYDSRKCSNIRSALSFFKRKVKSLWMPYVLFNSFFVLIHNILMRLSFYTNDARFLETGGEARFLILDYYYSKREILQRVTKTALFQSREQLCGALWFFECMFIVQLMYGSFDCVIQLVSKKILKEDNQRRLIIQGIWSIVLLIGGYYLAPVWRATIQLPRAMQVYILIWLGECINCYKNRLTISLPLYVLIPGTVLSIIILYNTFGKISVAGSAIVNPVVFVVSSILGWVFIESIARSIYQLNLRRLEAMLSCISVNAIWILGLHFFSFKIINLFGVIYYDVDAYYIASFPVLYKHNIWAILYTAIGIGLPLLASCCASGLRRHIKKAVT